ncbi:hypothetical protein F511_01669 [Dorcoceras hygrometricum]|uniref:Uncharacterized protein n=1 Tax=Dorcoceras hygrometricum TaxID=472368 RepID=A0A2Z7A7B9_9LAMI|nr:hypothetical protein F511_01669 [Dorcoceras hygrometricum]
MLYLTCAACLDWSRSKDIQTGTVRGRLSWTGRRYHAGKKQHEDKAHIEEQNDEVQNGSSADQNISTSWLVISWEWSKAGALKQLEEQERTEQAQQQTKRGADAEVPPEDQLEDENKEAACLALALYRDGFNFQLKPAWLLRTQFQFMAESSVLSFDRVTPSKNLLLIE